MQYFVITKAVIKILLCVAMGIFIANFAKYDLINKAKGAYAEIRDKYHDRAMESVDRKHAYYLVEDKLISRGIKFRMGDNFSPFDYLIFRLLLGLAIGCFCMLFHPYLIIPGWIIGYYIIGWYFKHKDDYDNGEMISDISQMYGIVALQLKNDIFIADVIYECALNVEYPRLKKALNELAMEIKQFSDIKKAADSFRRKFNNEHIDMFAKTLEQAQDTGSAVDLFKDIESQIKGINEAIAIREEKKITNICDMFQIGIFLSAILFVVYIMMNMMSSIAL